MINKVCHVICKGLLTLAAFIRSSIRLFRVNESDETLADSENRESRDMKPNIADSNETFFADVQHAFGACFF